MDQHSLVETFVKIASPQFVLQLDEGTVDFLELFLVVAQQVVKLVGNRPFAVLQNCELEVLPIFIAVDVRRVLQTHFVNVVLFLCFFNVMHGHLYECEEFQILLAHGVIRNLFRKIGRG